MLDTGEAGEQASCCEPAGRRFRDDVGVTDSAPSQAGEDGASHRPHAELAWLALDALGALGEDANVRGAAISPLRHGDAREVPNSDEYKLAYIRARGKLVGATVEVLEQTVTAVDLEMTLFQDCGSGVLVRRASSGLRAW